MFFTQEDYKKIENWLKLQTIKDTDFTDALLPLTGNETIAFVLNDKNVKSTIKEIVDLLSLLGVSDFLNITDKYKEDNISLTQAITLIPYKSRKIGQTITFINEEGKWVLYQFQGFRVNQWNNLTLWYNLIQKLEGDNIIPDEEDLTSFKRGDNTIFKFKDKAYIPEDFSGLGRVYLRKNIVTVEDSTTLLPKTINLLTQNMVNKENTIYHILYDYDLNGTTVTIPKDSTLLFEGGSINNGTINGANAIIENHFKGTSVVSGTFLYIDPKADEEDITLNNVISLKNKEYDPSNYSGLGRVYLKKNIINGKNILTLEMVNKANTIYHIQYDYDLNNQTITIPENCVLKFNGGKLSNGIIESINTINIYDGIFNEVLIKFETYIYIYNCKFSGENSTRVLDNFIGDDINKRIIKIYNCTFINIGTKLKNLTGSIAAIKLYKSNDITIDSCVFDNIGSLESLSTAVIRIGPGDIIKTNHCSITNNRFSNIIHKYTDQSNIGGIFCILVENIKSVFVQGNYFNVTLLGFDSEVIYSKVDEICIDNNKFYGTAEGEGFICIKLGISTITNNQIQGRCNVAISVFRKSIITNNLILLDKGLFVTYQQGNIESDIIKKTHILSNNYFKSVNFDYNLQHTTSRAPIYIPNFEEDIFININNNEFYCENDGNTTSVFTVRGGLGGECIIKDNLISWTHLSKDRNVLIVNDDNIIDPFITKIDFNNNKIIGNTLTMIAISLKQNTSTAINIQNNSIENSINSIKLFSLGSINLNIISNIIKATYCISDCNSLEIIFKDNIVYLDFIFKKCNINRVIIENNKLLSSRGYVLDNTSQIIQCIHTNNHNTGNSASNHFLGNLKVLYSTNNIFTQNVSTSSLLTVYSINNNNIERIYTKDNYIISNTDLLNLLEKTLSTNRQYNINLNSNYNSIIEVDTKRPANLINKKWYYTDGFIANNRLGNTLDRPIEDLEIGFPYYDTTLNRPIWWNGTTWINADGTPLV